MPSNTYLILRSAQRARLEGRKTVMQPFVSILAQPRSAFRLSPRHTPLRAGLSPQSGSAWNVLLHGQTVEAWSCETSRRPAAFVVSPMRGQGALSGRMDRRQRRATRDGRAALTERM